MVLPTNTDWQRQWFPTADGNASLWALGDRNAIQVMSSYYPLGDPRGIVEGKPLWHLAISGMWRRVTDDEMGLVIDGFGLNPSAWTERTRCHNGEIVRHLYRPPQAQGTELPHGH